MDRLEGDEWPDFLFGTAGIAQGPDDTVLGLSGVTHTLARVLGLVPRHSERCLAISFFFEKESVLTDKRVKAGFGRRGYYQRLNLASVDIGIQLKDYSLSKQEYAHLVAHYVSEGFEHLVPYLHKKGVEFDEERMREELRGSLEAFETLDQFEEHYSDEGIRQFLKARHPVLYEKIVSRE